MSFVAKLINTIQRLDCRWWPAHRVALDAETLEALRNSKLIIADVGAALGPEE